MQVQGKTVMVHASVICLCGDVPTSNYMGGFKGLHFHYESVGEAWLLQLI